MSGNAITLARIEAAAADQSSLDAARKLLVDGKWPSLQHDAGHRLLWGACQGSAASAYRVAVDIADLGSKCSCPSRKFPCKHALALMWWFAERAERFTAGAVPDWVAEWQGRRRRPATQDKEIGESAPRSASAATAVEAAAPRDAEAVARQKERTRAARETSIAQGLDELDLWIGDQLDRGLGAFGAQAVEQCRLLAQRLVDAKAGGLANLVDELPALYFGTPEARRPDALLEQFGALHLLAQAYRRQPALGPALANDVRSRVGWTLAREELMNAADAPRHRANWTVLATRRESQPDSLVRYETFLATAEAATGEVRMAMLLDYAPAAVAANAGPGLMAGTELDAELVYYPSATPLRAMVGAQQASAPAPHAPRPRQDLRAALDHYDALLAVNPWIAGWPICFRDAHIQLAPDGSCWAVDRHHSCGVPLAGEHASMLLDLEQVELFGIFDGRELAPLAANSPLGSLWVSHA